MLIDLLQSSYFSVFLIVALGFMLGRIKVAGLSLDVSAVILSLWRSDIGAFPYRRSWATLVWCCLSLLLVFRRDLVFSLFP